MPDILYFPLAGRYLPNPQSIYAQFEGTPPNPCRKYHVSSDLNGAERVAGLVLPFLANRGIMHKVVKTRRELERQTNGAQAGKFITIYMSNTVDQLNPVIVQLGSQLAELSRRGLARPCPTVPKSRRFQHIFIEQPLDRAMFIYGGYECDPYE